MKPQNKEHQGLSEPGLNSEVILVLSLLTGNIKNTDLALLVHVVSGLYSEVVLILRWFYFCGGLNSEVVF